MKLKVPIQNCAGDGIQGRNKQGASTDNSTDVCKDIKETIQLNRRAV